MVCCYPATDFVKWGGNGNFVSLNRCRGEFLRPFGKRWIDIYWQKTIETQTPFQKKQMESRFKKESETKKKKQDGQLNKIIDKNERNGNKGGEKSTRECSFSIIGSLFFFINSVRLWDLNSSPSFFLASSTYNRCQEWFIRSALSIHRRMNFCSTETFWRPIRISGNETMPQSDES